MDLGSSVNISKTVTQIFHGNHGEKRTITGLIPETIKDGSFCKIMRTDGSMILVNPNNVFLIEVFPE